MHVFNQNVAAEFYQAFVALVEGSALRGEDGSITLFTDGTTPEPYAAFTPSGSTTPRPLGRGWTPNDLFAKALSAINPRPSRATAPDGQQHPGPGRWWWLCFVDTREPEGEQFRGVAVVEGSTLRDAIEQVATLRLYPGGQVASVPCTHYVPARRWRNRLLTAPDVIAARNDVVRA